MGFDMLAGFAAAGGQEELRCEWPPPSAISQVPMVKNRVWLDIPGRKLGSMGYSPNIPIYK